MGSRTLEFSREEQAQIYDAFRQSVYRICYRFGGYNEAWAEDATHDVFIKVFRSAARYDPERGLASWINRIAINTCISMARKDASLLRRARTYWRSSVEPETVDPAENLERGELALRFKKALMKLAPLERAVFTMHFLDQQKQSEVADALGLSPGYISKLAARGLKVMEGHLES